MATTNDMITRTVERDQFFEVALDKMSFRNIDALSYVQEVHPDGQRAVFDENPLLVAAVPNVFERHDPVTLAVIAKRYHLQRLTLGGDVVHVTVHDTVVELSTQRKGE